jgi:AhpD family alkylhydroperoxidase
MSGGGPRIPPGARRDIGTANWLFSLAAGRVTRTGPPNVFTTLGRNRRLLRRWLIFAGALMPRGRLPRADTELVILRVAHLCGCEYEWSHHESLGRRAGLSAEEVERVRQGPDAPGWTARQELILRAAGEMHSDRRVSDATWEGLRPLLSDADLIELCMLVGHYEMVAMTLNSLGVEPERAR